MTESPAIQSLVDVCIASPPVDGNEKFLGWEGIVAVLAWQGLRILLPVLREWVGLGLTAIDLKRQEIEKGLTNWAMEKEFDMVAAKQAATLIAANLNEKNIAHIIAELETDPQ